MEASADLGGRAWMTFRRVTLPASVTLGTSGSAAHWLSRQPPDLDMPRSLYRSDAPPSELAKMLKQAAADWQAFLAARADVSRTAFPDDAEGGNICRVCTISVCRAAFT